MIPKTKLKNRGFVLLEVLLAFGVALIIITGMISLGVATVRATTSNRAYAEAGKIAQREVERLKLLRDTSTNWTAFTSSPSTGVGGCTTCHIVSGSPYTVSGSVGTEGTGPSAITYSFKITSGTNKVDYIVYAKWTVGSAPEKTYMIEGTLTNCREN